MRNSSHVNCAVSHVRSPNVCACRTMKPPPPRATIAACGCNNLGADTLHLLQWATGNGDSAELQSQLGSGLCSISTLHTYLLFGSSFSSIFGSPPPSQRWRGLLPSSSQYPNETITLQDSPTEPNKAIGRSHSLASSDFLCCFSFDSISDSVCCGNA